MAHAHMPDEFYDLVSHHLPSEQPVGPHADGHALFTASYSKSFGSFSPPDAAGRMYPRKWVARAKPPIDASAGGKSWVSGTVSMPTCCICSDKRTNSTPISSSSMASMSVLLAEANRPVLALWTAAKKAANIHSWWTSMACPWPSA